MVEIMGAVYLSLSSFQAVHFLGSCLIHHCVLYMHLRVWHSGSLWGGLMDGWMDDEVPLDAESVGDS